MRLLRRDYFCDNEECVLFCIPQLVKTDDDPGIGVGAPRCEKCNGILEGPYLGVA